MNPRLSVVIPAHDEAAVIGRLLTSLVPAARAGDLELIVAANGCTDDTAAVAASFGSSVVVVETERASKIAALNAADAVAGCYPRAYVDADVVVEASALLQLGDVLGRIDGPLVAAPRMRVDLSRSSWPVRAHYRIWELTDYRQRGHVGSGVYALSELGRRRFGAFPEVIADDRFVQQQFRPAERGSVPESFTIFAPTTFRALLHRSTRAAAGNAQLHRMDVPALPSDGATAGMRSLIRRVGPHPTLWPAMAVFCVSYLLPRLLARRKRAGGRMDVWERDETSRR